MLMSGADYIASQVVLSQSWLFRLAYRLTLDLEDAKDLLQETVLKILDNKSHFTHGSNFKGWSGVIMKNIFINQYRRSSKIQINKSDSEIIQYSDSIQNKISDITPENNISENEILAKINNCPHDYFQSFKLFIAGYSYKEIAELLALPIGTVKSRIYTARKKLQSALSEYK